VDANLEHVILVDENDSPIGTAEKLDAHRRSALHRAFSVVIRDRMDRLLLQKRHIGKYHSGGLWTNACCGHPRPGEQTSSAALRRLSEEMGFACSLTWLGCITYRAEFENGLSEHEIVHVYSGLFDGAIAPNTEEADGFQWQSLPEVQRDVAIMPERYSVWFREYVAAEWPLMLLPPSEQALING
jgi:isopentenyl-diphosphate delta-isomerase